VLWLKDKSGKTACHNAAENGHVEVIEKLWDWAKELHIKTEEFRNEVWLSKDKSGRTARHMAAGRGHVQVLRKLWDWAEEMQLNPDE